MRRVLVLVFILSATKSRSQNFFYEDFENGVRRVDAGGRWTEVYDVFATRQTAPGAAHRGSQGLRVTRTMNLPTTDTDTQLEAVTTLPQRPESWLRWWMRVNPPIRLGPQALIGFGDTLIPNHFAVAHDPAGLFVTGYVGDGGFFFQRAADLPDAGWHLYELGAFGMGTVDGGLRLVIDGRDAVVVRQPFNFPDVGVHQVNVGMTYGSPRTFQGSIDYDDVRASGARPAGRLEFSTDAGLAQLGDCVNGRLSLVTSDGLMASAVADVSAVRLGINVPHGLSLGSSCGAPPPMPLLLTPGTTGVGISVRVNAPIDIALSVSAEDLFGATATWPVNSGAVIGMPDASIPDGGSPGAMDASVADSGSPDASTGDAGAADASFVDAGPSDAGFPDASSLDADAGPSDAGPFDAGEPDAGNASMPVRDAGRPGDGGDAGAEPLALQVGCGCDAESRGLWVGVLAWLWSRRRVQRGRDAFGPTTSRP